MQKQTPSNGYQAKTCIAGHRNLNVFEFDKPETICDFAIVHRAKWKKTRARKPRSGFSPNPWASSREKSKTEYSTLAEALAARSSMVRKRGKRHKRLRPYKAGPSAWCLTKMRKGQMRSFLPVCPR